MHYMLDTNICIHLIRHQPPEVAAPGGLALARIAGTFPFKGNDRMGMGA